MIGPLAPPGTMVTPLASSSGFSPRIFSPSVWLKASLGVFQNTALTTPATADGDPVGGWSDQSTNGRNATQGTSNQRPLLKLGSNGIGNLPALLFDGSNDNLRTGAFTFNQPNTVYVVFKMVAIPVGHNAEILDSLQNVSPRELFAVTNTSKYALYAGTVVSESGATADLNAHVAAFFFNGASSKLYIDNTLKISGDPGSQAMSGIILGDYLSGTAAANMLLAEVVVFGGVVQTSAQQTLMQNYLAGPRGITLN